MQLKNKIILIMFYLQDISNLARMTSISSQINKAGYENALSGLKYTLLVCIITL